MLRVVLPERCVFAAATETCSLSIDHYRARKTGPGFPVAVVGCSRHPICRFTLYPPGHIPYGRQAVVSCSPSGPLLRHPATGQSAWEATLFGAAVDAAEGQRWPAHSPADDERRLRTQGCRLTLAGTLLGVHPDLEARTREWIATRLRVPTMTLRSAAGQWASSWQARGGAIRVPFEYGTLAMNRGQIDDTEKEFAGEEIDTLGSFAEVVALGYTRFLDFQRLEEQNRALESANAQIEEANRLKSEFLARMSHDLRTPINAIIGYTRILLRRLKDSIDERQFRNLANIQTSADNLLILINEILDLSRIEAGRIDLKPEPVDLGQLVGECITSVAPLAKPGVEMIRELGDAPAINTDPDRIRRVVMNLLENAVKFTEHGSITVSLRPAEDGCELAVADTGVGIPAEDLPHIFEEFRQVERQVGEKTEGTGLGLAIAAKSVEMLGGTISAESEVGKGTTFTLRIGDFEGPTT